MAVVGMNLCAIFSQLVLMLPNARASAAALRDTLPPAPNSRPPRSAAETSH